MTWTREDDVLIATRIEGRVVKRVEGYYEFDYPNGGEPIYMWGGSPSVWRYNLLLSPTVTALEKWVGADGNRWVDILYRSGEWRVDLSECFNESLPCREWAGESANLPAAIAFALRSACQ